MLKLNILFPLLFLFAYPPLSPADRNSHCDIVGDWSQVTLFIEPLGKMQKLVFEKKELSESDFVNYSHQIHEVYTSGQGNMDIDMGTTLSFSRNKISYKGENLGKYKISEDCKTITINKFIHKSPDVFASCIVLFRYENIIALKQGDQTTFYLRRNPENPFFVGNGE